jgi:signal transduction histidine kinase
MTNRLLSEEESLRNQMAEVERATAELHQAQTQLVRSERMASVGRLAAGLAHEIGNPIAAVMGLQDLLLEGDLSDGERRDFLRRMRSETERINRTLRDLLDFARSPNRKPEGRAEGDVEAAVHDTATLVLHQASMKNLQLEIDVHPGLPEVKLATEQLMQVLLNLVLNAADALSEAQSGRVLISARRSGGGVLVQVTDNGPGVGAEVVEQIFEPFFTTKEVGKGTGLGLSVCQGLVEGAGGRLQLDPSFRDGARFDVWLPALTEPSAVSGQIESAH